MLALLAVSVTTFRRVATSHRTRDSAVRVMANPVTATSG